MCPAVPLDDAHARAFGLRLVAGVDEVGRGPLAGPVVAAAVVVPEGMRGELLKLAGDSKVLSEKKRLLVAELVHGGCQVGIGEASVEEIDTLNILQATFVAMRRALALVAHEAVVIDGNAKLPGLMVPQVTVVGGDGIELAVACASVVAKVHRDELMRRLAEEFPAYGWHSNAGYGARVHMEALQSHGATIHHRKSFAPVRLVLEAGQNERERDGRAA